MARRTQADRFRTMLALLPYLHRGERVRVSDLARVLGTTQDDIVEDVYALIMVGVPPYSPDAGAEFVSDLRAAMLSALGASLADQGVLPVVPASFRSSASICATIAH